MGLFRQEAIDAQQARWTSDIMLAGPPSFTIVTASATLFVTLLVLFLIFATYTRRTTVAGQLLPDLGLIKVYSSQSGLIAEKHIREGEPVERDKIAYVVSGERRSETKGRTQELISEEVRARQRSLQQDRQTLERLEAAERSAISQKADALQTELTEVEDLILAQHRRVALAIGVERRYKDMLARGYVSQDQMIAKEADRMEIQSRLDSLYRERVSLTAHLRDQQAQLRQLSLKYANQQSDLTRAIGSAAQELSESEARRRFVVSVPESGTATAVIGEVGQIAANDRPLFAIVPKGSTLVAHFYLPSRAVGFITPGNRVRLRIRAYPYQKFGHQSGTVTSVARVALPSAELTATGAIDAAEFGPTQPAYLVSVRLDSQSVRAYGELKALQAGMLVDADILQETRRLYEWMLEPLFSISGRIRPEPT